MKSFFWVVVALLLSTSNAQTSKTSPFFQVHGGVFLSAKENFSNIYQNTMCLNGGFGAGIKVSSNISVYAKASFISKTYSGDLPVYSYTFPGMVRTVSYEDGKAEFTEKILNFGLMVRLYDYESLRISGSGGVSKVSLEEKTKMQNTSSSLSISSEFIGGFYLGISGEYLIPDSHFSAIFEIQDDFIQYSPLANAKIGGVSVTAGIRFYTKGY